MAWPWALRHCFNSEDAVHAHELAEDEDFFVSDKEGRKRAVVYTHDKNADYESKFVRAVHIFPKLIFVIYHIYFA